MDSRRSSPALSSASGRATRASSRRAADNNPEVSSTGSAAYGSRAVSSTPAPIARRGFVSPPASFFSPANRSPSPGFADRFGSLSPVAVPGRHAANTGSPRNSPAAARKPSPRSGGGATDIAHLTRNSPRHPSVDIDDRAAQPAAGRSVIASLSLGKILALFAALLVMLAWLVTVASLGIGGQAGGGLTTASDKLAALVRIWSPQPAQTPDEGGLSTLFINYLAPSSGAVINPVLSSPSMYHFKGPGDSKFPLLTQVVAQHVAEEAIAPWFENGDAWCTSTMHVPRPSASGQESWGPPAPLNPFYGFKGQLAVALGYDVYLDRVHVDGPPSAAMLDPQSAPAALSLWVEVLDAANRMKLWSAVLGVPEKYVDAVRPPMDAPPARNRFRMLYDWAIATVPEPADMGLGERWVRVARHELTDEEREGGRTVFPVEASLKDLDIRVRRIVIRVESTAGQPYACLHQVRLGAEREGLKAQ